MTWIYILIRTFPFWAIPIGVALLGTGLSKKGKKKFAALGATLILGGILFLAFEGHFKAVPWVHEMLTGDRYEPGR
jgi:hypothetical protein